jgi:hypothetical protein
MGFVPRNDRQSSRLALLPIPVIALVLAFTAVPTELRALSHDRIRDFFGIRFDDFVANFAEYVPVGAVLANLETGTAIELRPQCLSSWKRCSCSQAGRSSQLTDVAASGHRTCARRRAA